MLPLTGTTVVSFEQAVAAPFATRQMADLGARVIKVERPGVGDFARSYDTAVQGGSSYFVWLNRGKESIELDLKDPKDRGVLDAMVASADVVVQNLAPGAVERLGLDAVTLRETRPELIHCSINGYGSSGPYQHRKAYDLLVQCETGLPMTTGTPDVPSKVGVPIADMATGMFAYSGILTALLQRTTHGIGATLEVAMIDAMAEWMSQAAYHSIHSGEEPRRTGARHAQIGPYGPYQAGDGHRVFLAVQSDREWVVLCHEVLQRPDLALDARFATNPDRVAQEDAVRAIVEAAFSEWSADEVVERLDAAGIASGRLRAPSDLAHHPQMSSRDRWHEVGTPHGDVRSLLPPVTMSGVVPAMGDIPALGQHNATLRAEFGEPRMETYR